CALPILEVKAVDDGDGFVRVSGMATTPAADRMGDVVEPRGAKFATPMPLLWQHRHSEPVGQVTFAEPTEKGIPFEARIPKVAEAGRLKDRVDEAINSLTSACGCLPPDTNGDVSDQHYIQWVNSAYQIFDKTTGTPH